MLLQTHYDRLKNDSETDTTPEGQLQTAEPLSSEEQYSQLEGELQAGQVRLVSSAAARPHYDLEGVQS